MRSAEKAG